MSSLQNYIADRIILSLKTRCPAGGDVSLHKSTVVIKESGADSKVKWSPTQISSGSSLMGSINRKNKTNKHLLFFPKTYNRAISH